MKIIICSNITNGIGLQCDSELLRDWLIAEGHEVRLHQYDEEVVPGEKAELCIWLEVINPRLIHLADRHWIFCNPEWTKPETIRPIQRYCEKVFAKTRDAVTALQARFSNVHYTGFLSRDKFDPSIERHPIFLHLGGNSGFRNTNAVIDAWRAYRYWSGESLDSSLIIISNSTTVVAEPTDGIRFEKRVTEDELKYLQNLCLYHLMPSAYEGYGQALHESQSVGAILLTTAAPPMEEFGAPFEIPSIRTRKNHLGILHEVSPADIREAIPKMLGLPNHVVARMQAEARARFVAGNEEFKRLFRPFLDTGVRAGEKAVIAMIGNFGPEHSTENELLWTLRDMGHIVHPFQENEETTEEILNCCKENKVKLLLYISTHGWITPGKMTVDELIIRLRAAGIKTASFHLDRYWGLNELDRREDRVGEHPFWHTDYVFTADGGNQERFKARGINHYWLPPGVVKKDCYRGEPQPELKIDIGFVGAEGYHPEYPFRRELLEYLRSVYGKRFQIFTGYRGGALNNLYASIRVVVGDSCFGGSDRYWSDRIPETLGRGGFLIHPSCSGLTIPGLVAFEPGNLSELQDKIDWFLAHDHARQNCQDAAMSWVRWNETYHNRMAEMLKVCGI